MPQQLNLTHGNQFHLVIEKQIVMKYFLPSGERSSQEGSRQNPKIRDFLTHFEPRYLLSKIRDLMAHIISRV